MEAEAGGADRLRGQADAVDRDRATHRDERSCRRRLDLYLHPFVSTRYGDDVSDLTHDAGEHGLRLPAQAPSTARGGTPRRAGRCQPAAWWRGAAPAAQ